jgi:hypothetical protein
MPVRISTRRSTAAAADCARRAIRGPADARRTQLLGLPAMISLSYLCVLSERGQAFEGGDFGA